MLAQNIVLASMMLEIKGIVMIHCNHESKTLVFEINYDYPVKEETYSFKLYYCKDCYHEQTKCEICKNKIGVFITLTETNNQKVWGFPVFVCEKCSDDFFRDFINLPTKRSKAGFREFM